MRKAYSYIRMSSDKQLRGDSLRRQLDVSKKYASDNNLELVDSIDGIPLKDIGVSGFKGVNSSKGVLAIFLKALELQKIDPNSVLLIESLDRLSRAEISTALTQFMGILECGIEIITLTDNQRYTKEIINSNPGALYISLGIMFRANEESETKSKRIRAAWTNKRANASLKPLTSVAPAWLKLSNDRQIFEVIEERATIVRMIFDLCANTCGLWAITKYLNQHQIKTFGRSKFWNRSYVKKLLANRAVLGEYQPCSLINGKRQVIGEPISDYYPRIVTNQLFHLASAAIDSRTLKGAGRKGASFSNLFNGLVYCGSCGSKMSLRNRGSTPKGGRHLVCNNKLSGAGCEMPEWKLSALEQSIFKHLREVNFAELIGKESETVAIERELTALQNQLKDKELGMNNLVELVMDGSLNASAKSRLGDKLNQTGTEISELKEMIDKAENTLEEVRSQIEAFNTEDLKKTLLLIEENREDYFFRSSLNQLLARTISRIDLILENNVFLPWELSEDDSIVKEFYFRYPLLSKIKLDDLVEREDFKALWLAHEKRIRIQYKTGTVRQILVGSDISFSTQHRVNQV